MSSLDTRQMELRVQWPLLIGSHLDVVPANPETWERNPFKLVVEVGGPERFNLFSPISAGRQAVWSWYH